MKKIYTLVLVAFTSGTFAQSLAPTQKLGAAKSINPIHVPTGVMNIAAGDDTLGLANFITALSAGQVGVNATSGGYLFGSSYAEFSQAGTNYYSKNLAFANIYTASNAPYYVKGVILIPVLKYASNPTTTSSKLTVKVYSIADNNALYASTSTALDTTGLNTVLATTDILYSAIDTANGTVKIFPTSVMVSDDFGISVDFSTFAANGDSIAFPATQTPSGLNRGLFQVEQGIVGGGAGQAFWAWGNAIFQNYTEKDVVVFAIVGDQPVSISEQSFFDGLKLGQTYPNPTADNAKVEIELENASKNVILKVMDMKGRTLQTNELGTLSTGKHSFDLNVSDLASGNYLYMLTADGHNLVKQMSIVK